MTDYYVSSVDGSNVNDGSTWALAKENLEGVLSDASVAAGDTAYFDSAHDYDYVASYAPTSVPGSVENPLNLISVDRSGNPEPPTVYLAGATERVLAAGADLNFPSNLGFIAAGLTFDVDDNIVTGNTNYFALIECTIKYDKILMSGANSHWTFYDCTFEPGTAVGSNEGIWLDNGNRLNINGGAMSAARAAVEFLVALVDGSRGGQVRISDVDCSSMATSGFALVNVLPSSAATQGGTEMYFHGNKLPANGTITNGTFAEHVTKIEAYDNAIGASTVPGVYVQDYRGLTTEDSAVYRDAIYGGTSGYSLKSTGTTTARPGVFSHRVKLWERGLTAANPLLTVQLLTDGAVTFDAADVWIDFVYPAAGGAGTITVSTVDANHGLGTPSALAAGVGTGAWTSPPAGSTSYQIAQQISGGRAGVHEAWLSFAPGAAAGLFACPRVDVT